MGEDLGDVFVKIRADAQELSGGLRAAHQEAGAEAERAGTSLGEKLTGHFKSQILRGIGIMEGVRLASASVAGGLKAIEEQNLIDPGKGNEALQHLIKFREAQREILRDLPFVGGVATQISRTISGDAALELQQRKLEALQGGPEAEKAARAAREKAELAAAKALGTPAPIMRTLEAERQDRDLATQETELRRKAADARALQDKLYQDAQGRRGSLGAQFQDQPWYVKAAVGAAGPLGATAGALALHAGHAQLTTAEAEEAATQEAGVQATGYERAARDIEKTRKLDRTIYAAGAPGAQGVVAGAVPQASGDLGAKLDAILDQLRRNAGQPLIVGN